MAEFEDSFNMMIGSVDTEVDLLDNPYIVFRLQGLNENYKPYDLESNLKLRKCTDGDLSFINEQARKFYPNSLCFEDRT